jgi:two-component system sensor histidine kinase YesM
MDMRPVGYLRADVRANAFRRSFPTELLDKGASILVVDGDRVVVFEGMELPTRAVAAVAAATDSSGSFVFHSGKVTYTASFFESRSYSWRIVGFVPSGRIGKAARRLRDITAVISAGTILVFFAVSWFIMRRFLSPIHRIADDMRKWDLSTKVDAQQYGGTDEVAFLSSRFSEMMERIRTLVDQLVDERSRLHRQELAALQAQINPHFLYNTLEIVNWMAIERGAPDIASIVRALSDMMRYAIGNGAETAAAADELSYVERYLSLQSFRFPDKFETRINASDEARRCGMPKLCLQPIVENSVQHAFKGLRRKGTISVSLDIEGNELVAIIADDGNGMDRETLDRLLTEKHDGSGIETMTRKADHAGIGVSNVDLRLKLRYGQAYGLSYMSAPGEGTTCTLRIPVNGGTV